MGVTRSGTRTYWHFASARRMPSRYELASTDLLFSARHGFAIRSPLTEWYRRHQEASPFVVERDRFEDPRHTTYASYTELMASREVFVDGLLALPQQELGNPWLDRLGRAFAPLRYPAHALMMATSYLGSMAPCSRITLAAAFQAADEMRRVHRFAHRLRTLEPLRAGLGHDARLIWEDDPAWQPLRELVERTLVAYDWGECFVALALVTKPAFDLLTLEAYPSTAEAAGDNHLFGLLCSLAEDARWHRAWSRALVESAIDHRAQNREILRAWLDRWRPLAGRAIEALAPLYDSEPASVVSAVESFHAECGLS